MLGPDVLQPVAAHVDRGETRRQPVADRQVRPFREEHLPAVRRVGDAGGAVDVAPLLASDEDRVAERGGPSGTRTADAGRPGVSGQGALELAAAAASRRGRRGRRRRRNRRSSTPRCRGAPRSRPGRAGGARRGPIRMPPARPRDESGAALDVGEQQGEPTARQIRAPRQSRQVRRSCPPSMGPPSPARPSPNARPSSRPTVRDVYLRGSSAHADGPPG